MSDGNSPVDSDQPEPEPIQPDDQPEPSPTSESASEPEPTSLTLQVSITADDIANGVPNSMTKCPAALAITRALAEQHPEKGFNYVHVGMIGTWLAIREPDNSTFVTMTEHVRHPDALLTFIRAFDRVGSVPDGAGTEPVPDATVQPLNFELTFKSVLQV